MENHKIRIKEVVTDNPCMEIGTDSMGTDSKGTRGHCSPAILITLREGTVSDMDGQEITVEETTTNMEARVFRDWLGTRDATVKHLGADV